MQNDLKSLYWNIVSKNFFEKASIDLKWKGELDKSITTALLTRCNFGGRADDWAEGVGGHAVIGGVVYRGLQLGVREGGYVQTGISQHRPEPWNLCDRRRAIGQTPWKLESLEFVILGRIWDHTSYKFVRKTAPFRKRGKKQKYKNIKKKVKFSV